MRKQLVLLAVLCFIVSVSLTSCSTGGTKFNKDDVVIFGHYEQDGEVSNGLEDIEWIVLDTKGSNVMLLSKYVIDVQKYNAQDEAVTWETCSLRSWLNSTFLESAFSSEEQSAIQVTDVTASQPSHIQGYIGTSPNVEAGNDTKDKVFVLGYEEANSYLTVSNKEAKRTAYAKTLPISNDGQEYWLRSPHGHQDYAATLLSSDRTFAVVGFRVDCSSGVRPVIWVRETALKPESVFDHE